MYVTHLKLKNWRNFQNADLPLSHRSYVIGPNACGKSNLLDVFCFLRDICKPAGGGLQKAVADRGGIGQLRCLQARRDTEVSIEFHFSDRIDAATSSWRYMLGFQSEGKRNPQLRVSSESVWRGEKRILSRPDPLDQKDVQLLTETHLEQTRANGEFRAITDFFRDTTYLHLVPQLLKFRNKIGGNHLEDDPFGQEFLERVATCSARTREARFRKINSALVAAVPQFKAVRFTRDAITAQPHLEALYESHRSTKGWQREEHFSDGTLRLLGLLWSLLDGNGLLLIEEPELSLHQAVVERIPLLMIGYSG